MASGRLLVPAWNPALDNDGDPIPNVSITFWENLTTELAAVYTDEALTVPAANPVLANVAGRFPTIWASDAMTYSYSVDAPYGPAGIPFTGDGLTVSMNASILILEATEAAAEEAEFWADSAEASAEDSADSAETSADILAQIEAIIATAPEAPSVLNKLNRSGDNANADFLDNLTFSNTYTAAALRPMRQKLMDEMSIMDFNDDSGNPVDGFFSVIDDALDSAFEQGQAIYLPPGDYVIQRQHAYLPVPPGDVPPLPNPSAVGAFAQGLQVHGAGVISSRLHNRVANGYAFKLNVTNPPIVPPATTPPYRAEMGPRFSNFAMIGLSSVTNSGGIEIFNGYQGFLGFLHLRNMTGSALKLVNGLEGDVPDSGWNCLTFSPIWIEGCGYEGNGWGIDATGVEGRNEGSFTTLRQVFMQSCGKNQYFTATGVSTANPAIVTLSLNQMPAVTPTVTAHPFVLGDRVGSFGVKKTQTLGANPITTVLGTPVVTIASTAHGLAIGDNVHISGASAVGGITLDGDYQITSLPGSGSFTVIHSAAATSAATGGGAAVVLVSPMKAMETHYYVGPTVTATTLQLYTASGAAVSLVADALTTTSGSAVVSVTRAAHGLTPGMYVVMNYVVPFNGVTIDKGYVVGTVPDANTFTITASTLATASGAGGGTVAKYQRIVTFDGASIGTWTSNLPTPTTLANNPIATLDGSAVVTITHNAHGAVVGDLVTIAGAAAVGGITIAGQYRVNTVPHVNAYTIVHSSAATSTVAAGGGAAVTALYVYRSTRVGEFGYYEPQSGALRYKGQLLLLDQCGFTLNHNGAATYVKGGGGGAIGMRFTQTTWENNYRGHLLAKGGINYHSDGCQFHGNNTAGLFQWYGFRFDCTENTIQQVHVESHKVRAKECPMVCFDYIGATFAQPNTVRIEKVLWMDYDYPGQVRYRGIQFDQLTQNLILTYSSTTAMILRPDQFSGHGNKTPLRMAGPTNDSGTGARSLTGEWVQWQLSSNNGLTLSNAGLAANTFYYVYLYDNDGVAAMEALPVAPAKEVTHGYMTLPGDPTRLFVGSCDTDAGGLFETGGQGYWQPRRLGGNQAGIDAWEWDDWSLERTLKRSGAKPTSAAQSTQVIPWLKLASKTHNFASIAAGATETTTLTTGVTAALGDVVDKVYLSIDQQTVVLHGWVSAANTITVIAQNIGGVAVDLANATLSATYYRNS